MHVDEPADLVHEVFSEALFPAHPLGREVLGEEATITGMTPDDIANFFSHHYRPQNIVMAAAGRIDHDEIVAGIERRFAGPDGGSAPVRRPPQDRPEPLMVVHRPTEQAHVVLGMAALDRDDDDRYALAAMNHVLGGGMSSRLFQEIRERRGLAYSVYSYRSAYEGAGSLAVYAGTAPGRVHEVLDLMHAEIDRMVASGVDARELELAKGHLKGTMALSLEDSAARMSRIGRSQLVHGKVPTFDEVIAEIEAVTLDDVARVVHNVLGNERVLAVVGPFEDRDFATARVA